MKRTVISKIVFSHTSLYAQKHQTAILALVAKVVESGIFLYGPQTKLLESSLQVMFGRYCTCVASGHDSLLFALQVLQLTEHDEVIFPVNAYPTAFPVLLSGARPVPVDVDENGQMSLIELRKNITKNTKVIILVHLYGLVGSDFIDITRLAHRHNITLIEDCAQSFGTMYGGKYAGTYGDIACFSFYPTKNLGALGDGGALITNKKKYDRFFKKARQYGEKVRYISEFVSGHSRMPEIQAAILNLYLSHYKQTLEKRKKVYNRYVKELTKGAASRRVRLMQSSIDSEPAVHLFVIEAIQRDHLMSYLDRHGIPTAIHYPFPIHTIPAFASITKKRFPMAERLARNNLSLPFHEYLTRTDITYIVSHINKFYAKT